jgi:hypothetical protein
MLVLGAAEPPEAIDVGIELHAEAGALQRLDAARERAKPGRVRRRDDPNQVALGECGWAEQRVGRIEGIRPAKVVRREPD